MGRRGSSLGLGVGGRGLAGAGRGGDVGEAAGGLDASARTRSRRGVVGRAGRGGRGVAGAARIGEAHGGGRGGGATPLDAITPSRHLSNAEERSVRRLVHGDDDDAIAASSNLPLEDPETGLPIKSVAAGETMDPLLMACPVERTPTSFKSIKKTTATTGRGGGGSSIAGDFLSQSMRPRSYSGGASAMRKDLDMLSQSSRASRSRARRANNNSSRGFHRAATLGESGPTATEERRLLTSSKHKRVSSLADKLPAMPAVQETTAKDDHREGEQHPEEEEEPMERETTENGPTLLVVEDDGSCEVSHNPLMACCVAPDCFALDFLNNDEEEMTPEDAAAEEKKSPEEEQEKKETEEARAVVEDVESKKRYLHLTEEKAPETESDRQRAKLSTWLGAPEDYPILGLDAKRTGSTSHSVMGRDDGAGDEWKDGEEAFEDPLEPHVLSPLLMKSLRDHLPFAVREENFWLKYSLVRDGASLDVVFDTMRHSQHTVLAIETAQGEVLGSFTSSPWRANGNNYYGSCEAFVWNLRKSRRAEEGQTGGDCDLDEYVLRESSLEVFGWNSAAGNRNVQLSNRRKLFVGGGHPETDEEQGAQNGGEDGRESKENDAAEPQWGMALALDKELLRGTSGMCATFDSNPLVDKSKAGSEVFEIMNMEIWALTPCMNEEMAEELELGRTFVMGLNRQASESAFQ